VATLFQELDIDFYLNFLSVEWFHFHFCAVASNFLTEYSVPQLLSFLAFDVL
jgi:hypothetical protein